MEARLRQLRAGRRQQPARRVAVLDMLRAQLPELGRLVRDLATAGLARHLDGLVPASVRQAGVRGGRVAERVPRGGAVTGDLGKTGPLRGNYLIIQPHS